MTLTCQQVLDSMYVGLSGEAHAKLGSMNLANYAGNWLMAARPWAWSMRVASLDVVPGASRIYLPEDFRGAVAVSGAILGSLSLTSVEAVVEARESTTGPSFRDYTGFLTYAETIDGDMVPAIEVFPDINVSATTRAGTIGYTAAWRRFEQPSDKARIPWFMEPLLLAAANAYVLGRERPKFGTVGQRLAEVVGGPEWGAAVQTDDQMQTDFGRLEDGDSDRGVRNWKQGWQFPAGDPVQIA